MNNKKGRPKEFVEEEAMAVAMNLFWSNGYEKTSLDDLIKAMNISKSSFYQSFKSKRALFQSSLGFYFHSNCNALSEMQSQYSSKMILVGFIERLVDELKETGSVRGCLLMNSGAECYSKHPDLIPVISEYYDAGIEQYQKLIEDAQKKGDMKNPMDAKKIAILFYSSLTGLSSTIKVGASEEAVGAIVEEIKRLID